MGKLLLGFLLAFWAMFLLIGGAPLWGLLLLAVAIVLCIAGGVETDQRGGK